MSFVECKNPLKMYPHYILESKSINGKYFDHLQYCGVCRNLAFEDNAAPSRTSQGKKLKPFPDSKINPKSGPCSNDCL